MSLGYAYARGRSSIPRIFRPGSSITETSLLLVLTMAIGLGAVAGREGSTARVLIGGLGGLIFFLISLTGRFSALRLAIIWLVLMGLVRRMLIPVAGWSAQDPLLLVGPACAVMIWLNGRDKSRKLKLDLLTFFAIAFLFISVAQIFNPKQASVIDGAIGALFWIPSMLWFFAGRTFPLSLHKKIVDTLFLLAIPIAIHGLYQTYVGLLPFEYTWVGVSGFGEAIFYEGFKIRSFSTLTSPQEYGQFLSFVCVMLYGTILAGHSRRFWRIALLLFFTWALFMQGSRSIFGFFVISIVAMTVVWTKKAGLRFAMVGVVALAVLLAQKVQPPHPSEKEGAGQVIAHQLQGLLNPTSEEGTGPLHFLMITEGFKSSLDNPLGLGTAPTTILTVKKGATKTASTENDVSTVFVALGVPAGILYIFFLFALYAVVGIRFKNYPSAYAIGTIGLTVAFVGQIWAGASYAVTALIWLTIGGLSRGGPEESKDERSESTAQPTRSPGEEGQLQTSAAEM